MPDGRVAATEGEFGPRAHGEQYGGGIWWEIGNHGKRGDEGALKLRIRPREERRN